MNRNLPHMSAGTRSSRASEGAGIWGLLTSNGPFVRVWAAQLISFAGDWINSVALLDLILRLTNDGMMVSLLIVCSTLPLFVLMPLAGVVADRFNRRRIMILTNLLQAFLALGFLLVERADQIWLIYLLSIAMVTCEAFFAPASGAAIPNLVSPRHLAAANSLAGSSWGTMVAIGSAVGGFVAGQYGRDAAFVLNAASFVAAACLIASVRVPFSAVDRSASEASPSRKESVPSLAFLRSALTTAVEDFREGIRYALRHRSVLALLLVKTFWGMGGGVLALLSVLPVEVLHAGAGGIGTLYASRGVGAVMGPLLTQWAVGDRPHLMAVFAALGVTISGVFYVAFSMAPNMLWASIFVFLAHLGGGMQWVLTATLLQRMVADRMLGRISSLDWAGFTLTMTLSSLACGWGIHARSIGPRLTGFLAGTLMVALGLAWIAWYGWLRRPDFEHRDRAPA